MKKITVTKPYLPPLEEFNEYLKVIWDSNWLTNNGKFHQQLEESLSSFLGVPYISLFSNGTLALITALQCLRITGEVITTPYSFVATTHSLWWNNIKPVFVDIDPIYGNIDPEKIESAITSNTTAILPVHVYGNPCQNDKIQKIADTYGLKLIYDAAHAFGVKKNGNSILNWGDLSILSFHATKVFNTFEGGAIICHDKKTKDRIDDLKNFGFHNETTVVAPGINAKMNELQASMGLLQLKYIEENIAKRKAIANNYTNKLTQISQIRCIVNQEFIDCNYSYFPIFITKKSILNRDYLYNRLKEEGIYCRRYFYPLISSFPPYKDLSSAKRQNLPIATKLANEVLCLPIYPDLSIKECNKIIDVVIKFFRTAKLDPT